MKEFRTALITGATGTIGRAISKLMAKKGYSIVFIARNRNKAEKLVAEIRSVNTDCAVSFHLLDMGEKKEIKALSENFHARLDVLINNAALTPRTREETYANIERQWAVNVLGYYWMMKYFSPHLKDGDKPRIVNVASYWAGQLDLSDPEFRSRNYDNNTAYMQSKQADRMLSKGFAGLLEKDKISVNSCHPGDARSNLSSSLGFGGHESPEQAADTPVWLATEDAGFQTTGAYFRDKRKSICQFSENKNEVDRLMRICASY